MCSFQKKMLSNLTCVLIYSLTKYVLEDGFKDSCVLKICTESLYCICAVYCKLTCVLIYSLTKYVLED